MSEPTGTSSGDGGLGDGPGPKGSAPAPGFGSQDRTPAGDHDTGSTTTSPGPDTASGSGPVTDGGADRPAAVHADTSGSSDQTATTAFPAAQQHRAEGTSGGVAKAHQGGAAGRAAPMVSPAERRGPMESVLVVKRIDPWSAFTTVLGLMFALFLVWMVAVGVVYLLLSGMGVWDRLGGLLSGVAGDASASAIGPSTIFLYAGGVGLLNVLLMSILATLSVFIYNLAAGLTGGGVQVTLGDRRR